MHGISFGGYQRRTPGLEPRCNAAQRLSLTPLLLLLARFEVCLPASCMRGKRRSSRCLQSQNMRLKGKWVYKLSVDCPLALE
jgi:hypothetical protein